jgi:CRISPR type I-D-associated protein Csc2
MSDQTALASLDSAFAGLRDPCNYSPRFTGRVATIVGLRTTTTRFVPKSHEGFSNEAYVDKEYILGEKRVAFTARKQKAAERRSHMRLLRQHVNGLPELAGTLTGQGKFAVKEKAQGINIDAKEEWRCELPHELCLRCPNCTLFGGLRPGAQFALMARARYQDSFSLEPTRLCVANEESDSGDMGIDGMAIGNTQAEKLEAERSSSSFFYYEYVRPGTHFPFILTILDPSILDLSGLLAAIELAAVTGYGSYASNQGKFRTHMLALALGLPRFSVFDMIDWTKDLWKDRRHLGDDWPYVRRLRPLLGEDDCWIGGPVVSANDGTDLARIGAELFSAQVRALDWLASSQAILKNYRDVEP